MKMTGFFLSLILVISSCVGWSEGYSHRPPAYQPASLSAVVPSVSVAGMAGYGFAGYPAYLTPIDPMAAAMPVPSSNMCFLYRPPPWCEGPRCLPVTNKTSSHIKFRIDGVSIAIPQSGDYLPPGETCWLIVDSVGQHDAEGDGFIGPPPLQRAVRCDRQFWVSATGRGHHGLSFENIECRTIGPQQVSP